MIVIQKFEKTILIRKQFLVSLHSLCFNSETIFSLVAFLMFSIFPLTGEWRLMLVYFES